MVIAEPTVKSLRLTPRANGQDLATAATGFLVMPDAVWLITNWHVLSGRNSESNEILSETGATPDALGIRFHGIQLGQFNSVEVALRDESGDPLWFEHPVHGSSIDVAALRLPDDVGQVITTDANSTTYSTPISFYRYELSDVNPSGVYVSVGERLSVIGFPVGEDVQGFPIWTQGFVASEPDLRFRDLPCFLIDSRTREGQSGSPVVFYSANGQYPSAVGVTTLGLTQTSTRFMGVYSGRINSQSDIGRVWTPEAVAEVLHGGKRATCL